MTKLLLPLCLLAFATTGWAGEPIVGAKSCADYYTAPNGGCVIPYAYTDVITGPHVTCYQGGSIGGEHGYEIPCPHAQPDCLATMEAAMRAMEKLYFASQEVKLEMIHTGKYQLLVQQWTDAKRCWRTP